MMKQTKRLLAVLLALVLLCTGVPFAFADDVTIVDSGYCGADGDGTNLSWTLDSEGTLTISGEGVIRESAFSFNNMIKSVIIEEGVKSIGVGAFFNCKSLASVKVPDSVKSIGEQAFFTCPNLVIHIGKNVESIGTLAFAFCYSIDVDENNPYFSAENGVLFDKEKTILVAYPGARQQESYVVPETVENIELNAFAFSRYLKEIVLPASLKQAAFAVWFGGEFLQFPINFIFQGMNTEFSQLEGIDVIGASLWRFSNDYIEEARRQITNMLIYGDELDEAFDQQCEYSDYENGEYFYLGTIRCHAGSTAETYAKKHNMDYELVHFYDTYVSTTAPTCTEQGYSTYKCIYCDETENRDFVEPLDHDYIDHDALNPTCTETGWEAYQSCSRCDYTTYEEKPANGHTEVVDKAIASTCTESGLTEGLHCSVCSDVLVEQQIVPAHGHDFALGEIIDAKCSEDGQKIYVCKYDATHTRTETIPATGEHEDADNDGYCDTCEEMMQGGLHCKYCGKIHGGVFGWLVKFFHSILAIFKR